MASTSANTSPTKLSIKSDIKQDIKHAPEYITLQVTSDQSAAVQFKIKVKTPLNKLMKTYCERAHINQKNVRFVFDGTPVTPDDTPETMEMQEGDSIEVFQEQTGG